MKLKRRKKMSEIRNVRAVDYGKMEDLKNRNPTAYENFKKPSYFEKVKESENEQKQSK